MSKPVQLSIALTLGAMGVGCHDDGTWSGSVTPWAIPNTGSTDSRGDGDGDGDGDDEPWTPRDAGMDAQVDEYDPALSYFDAKKVYLMGTLSEGACGRDAIAPALQPDTAVIGFGCDADLVNAQIRPTDGRLLYTEDDVLYLFSSDTSDERSSNFNYPQEPTDNDEVLPTSKCSPSVISKRFSAFKVAASGELFYRCGSDWYDGANNFVATLSTALLQIGSDGTALTAEGIHPFASIEVEPGDAAVADAGDDAAVDADAGDASSPATDAGTLSDARSLRPFVGISSGIGTTIVASRARPDGYWVVLPVTAQPNTPTLWHIDFDGHASQVGSYPAPPANQQIAYYAKLDGDGFLYQMSRDTTVSFRDTIVQRNVQGASTVVYDEDSNPLVKIHISYLITGP